MGEKLKELRKSKGWTQKEAALQIGISVDTVKSIETGRSKAGLSTIKLIAKAFKCVSIDELLKAS